MIVSSRNLSVFLFVWLILAPHARAAEPDKPNAEQGAAPEAASKELPPVTNPADPLSPEMSAAETARVDEIIEEVRRLYQQTPHTALPADLKTPLYAERTGGYDAWIQTIYTDAWRIHGKHDPRWDDEAAKLIDDYLRRDKNHIPQRDFVARGRKLLAAGCDDPLIRLVIGNSLDLKAGTSAYQAVDVLKPALEQLPPDYLPAVAYRVELRFIEAWNRAWPNKSKESSDVVVRMLGRIVRIFAGPLTNDERRRHLHRFITDMHGPLARYLPRFFKRLADSGKAARWLLQVLLARAQVDRAWQQRGGGWASEVKPEGWQGRQICLAVR